MGNWFSREKEIPCDTCGGVFTNPGNKFTYLIHTAYGHTFHGPQSNNLFVGHAVSGTVGNKPHEFNKDISGFIHPMEH